MATFPPPDDDHLFPFRIGVFAHIDVEQIFDARNEAGISLVFALDAHGRAVVSAHADKEGVEFLRKRGEGHVFADHGVVPDLDAQVGHEIDLSAEYGPGKTVVGDAHGRHAARLGQPLEYRDAVAHLGKVIGHREPRGARAYDGDFLDRLALLGDRPLCRPFCLSSS